MISVDDIKITFNAGTPLENQALRGISLDIPAGQFVTVIGSNGAGKSTFLNALSGELRVTSGKISIANQDVTSWSVNKRAPLIARVFQDPLTGTCEALTIEENMALAMARTQKRGLSKAVKAEYLDRFKEKLATLNLGLEKRLQDRMGLLSGGQRQAVSLLMASLQPMKILLLDEHTAALDPKTAAFVLELTEQIIEEDQLTALMVTHSMKQALSVGSRTLMLHAGKVAFDVEGESRSHMTTHDLIALFSRNHGEVEDDSLLLG